MPTGLAELHTHLGGSVSSDILWTLAHEQGIALPVKDYWDFDRLVTVSDPLGAAGRGGRRHRRAEAGRRPLRLPTGRADGGGGPRRRARGDDPRRRGGRRRRPRGDRGGGRYA